MGLVRGGLGWGGTCQGEEARGPWGEVAGGWVGRVKWAGGSCAGTPWGEVGWVCGRADRGAAAPGTQTLPHQVRESLAGRGE